MRRKTMDLGGLWAWLYGWMFPVSIGTFWDR